LEAAGVSLDRSRNELRPADGPPIRLTPLEVRLLEALLLHPGQVLPGETLISTVWGPSGGDRAMLKQLVYRLRAKIETGGIPGVIETVPGIGYAWNPG
jgi:DNA-binding response OmpR family regulator